MKLTLFILLIILVLIISLQLKPTSQYEQEISGGYEDSNIRLMTYNLYHGGTSTGHPLSDTVNTIRQAGADIVGLQETATSFDDKDSYTDNTRNIALALGKDWNYFRQGVVSPWLPWRHFQSFIFRGKLLKVTPLKWGIKIRCKSKTLWVFNCHFIYYPYQPYQLLRIRYDDAPFLKTEEEAIKSAKVRSEQVRELLKEVDVCKKDNIPILLTGDFNEPSFLDWTKKAEIAKIHPIKVEWPATKMLSDYGFVDMFRLKYPDEVATPGFTWTTFKYTKKESHPDRIDFLMFLRNKKNEPYVVSVETVGDEKSDIVVPNYPSDHRAVVAELDF